MKITFISFHNWETNRQGGFHKFAESCAMAGMDVVFFSFSRPYYTFYKKDERRNFSVIRRLCRGVAYNIVNSNVPIKNFTWPTFQLPYRLQMFLPDCINDWLNTHSFVPFDRIEKEHLCNTDIFVLESCEAVELFDILKRYNPESKFIYRPSDPLVALHNSKYYRNIINKEWNVLQKSDLTFLVNEEGLKLYRTHYPNFDSLVKYKILSNGVDFSKYRMNYVKPQLLQLPNTILYVGAREIEWDLVLYAAERTPDCNYIVVCPEKPPIHFVKTPLKNVFFVNGIPSDEVPSWVTNCDLVMVPNPKGWYKTWPWGITAKYYQAMSAGKKIVAFEDTESLKKYGVLVSYTYDDFVMSVKNAMNLCNSQLSYDIQDKDWKFITQRFVSEIKYLCNC